MSPEEEIEFRRRQKARARVTALILGALVVLFFFMAIAKMQQGVAHG